MRIACAIEVTNIATLFATCMDESSSSNLNGQQILNKLKYHLVVTNYTPDLILCMEQLVLHCRDDLLSEDLERRRGALLSIHKYIDSHRSDLKDELQSLNYLFEFVLGRIKAEDCLDITTKTASLILTICSWEKKKTYADDLLSTLSPELSSNTRLCILELLQECIVDANTLDRFLAQVQGEKSPQALMAIFNVMEACKPILEPTNFESVFEAFSVYFPITFKSSRFERNVKEEDLRDKLRHILVLHPEMAHLALPFLNDKLAESTSSSIILECVKALKHAFMNASDSAIQAYFKESTNMLITSMTKSVQNTSNNDDDDGLNSAIFDFLANSFNKSSVYKDYLMLVSDHLQHTLKDKSASRMHHIIPSVVRFVGGSSEIATSILSSSLLPIIEPTIGACPKEAKIEWACLLAILCAQSESKCFEFRTVSPGFLLKCVNVQQDCLKDKSPQKDMLFAASFLEAVLRDPDALNDSHKRMAIMTDIFDLVESTKSFKSLYELIVQSIVKHQKSTLVGQTSQLLRYTSFVLVKSFLSDADLTVALITESIRDGAVGTFSLLSNAQLNAIDEQQRVKWILCLNDRECEECLDQLICSLTPSSTMALLPKLGPTAARLAVLSLPAELSSPQLLSSFKDDPEIKAALFNKHQQSLEELNVDSERAQCCILCAMILQQNDQLFEYLKTWSVEKSKLLDASYTRVNKGHRFVCKPYYEQWFMERVLSRPDLFSTDCALELLTNCSPSTLQAIDLQCIFDAAFTRPASSNVVKLLELILECDAFLLKRHCNVAIESLIIASINTQSTAAHRHAALKCLASMLDMISGATVLPFVAQFVKLLRPALGDKKLAVRRLAVRCTDLLYSFYV